jgi:hypothetical protein
LWNGGARHQDGRDTAAAEPGAVEAWLTYVVQDEVQQALASLPAAYRHMVVLADLGEYSYKDIAVVVGCPIGTVISRLSRGRKLLRQRLEPFAREAGYIQGPRQAGVGPAGASVPPGVAPGALAGGGRGPALTGQTTKRGGRMRTVIDPCEEGGVETVETSGGENEAPATITTTLYDLIAALQEVVHPGEEALVVATVVSLLRAGRIRAVARGLS